MFRGVLAVLAVLCLIAGVASGETIVVSTVEGLHSAVEKINDAESGEFIISLSGDKDFVTDKAITFSSNATKTILGNGHTITFSPGEGSNDSFIYVYGGKLCLGNKTDKSGSILNIKSNTGLGDSASCIKVAVRVKNKLPVLEMYDGVTISNCRVINSYGAGVRLFSHVKEKGQLATFNMYGGNIINCGFNGGSDQFGGGVAVMHNGVFNMSGGTISGCSAWSGGGVFVGITKDIMDEMEAGNYTVDEPVFNMTDGTIEHNYASSGGGGVSVTNGKFSFSGGNIFKNGTERNGGGVYVYVDFTSGYAMADGIFEMKGGEIEKNSARQGGGIYSQCRNVSYSDRSLYALKLEGGTIRFNTASSLGGGLCIIRSRAEISGSKITNNNAQYGGGILSLPGTVVLNGSGILCNNIASGSGTDYYGEPSKGGEINDIFLSSASGMNQKFMNGTEETGYPIDGWYWDHEDSDEQLYKWDYGKAFVPNSTNKYEGDTYNLDNGASALRAAFTPHRDIKITKIWNDANNSYNTRPEKITFALKENGNTVKLTNYDGSEKYAVTEMSRDETTAIIGPLAPDFNITGYEIVEIVEPPKNDYLVRSSEFSFTPDTNKDADGSLYKPITGTYSTTFTNTWPHLITVYNIWDDADNSNLRPDKLEISLEKNGTAIKDVHGNPATAILSANNWQHTFVLSSSESINGLEIHEDVPGYSQIKNIYLEGAGINAIVINKREHVAANVEATNESMVNITYNVEKEWSDGKYTVDHPEITIRLFADGTFVREQKLSASATSYTFTNLPKYKDNNSDTLVTYTIAEEINDENWVKIENEGNTYWYSLDGIGRYSSNVLYGSASNTMIQNTYEVLQEKGYVEFTKRWKDDKNENGVRPASIQIGLFENAESQTPVSINGQSVIIEMTSADPDNKAERWVKTAELPLYNEQGIQVDYSRYVVKEWNEVTNTWMNSGESIVIRDLTGREYEYKMSEGD